MSAVNDPIELVTGVIEIVVAKYVTNRRIFRIGEFIFPK